MSTYSHRQSPHRGFTLIEMMVVVAIIGTLASLAIPSYTATAALARERSRTVHFQALAMALVERWRTGAGHAQYTLPSSAGCGTGTIPNDLTYRDMPFLTGIVANSPQALCWGAISWGIDGSTKCRYTYASGTQPTPQAGSAYFQITSTCDTNDDGVTSTILLHCVPAEKTMCDYSASYFTYSGDSKELQPGTVAFGLQNQAGI